MPSYATLNRNYQLSASIVRGESTPIGIVLPIEHGNNGYFNQSFDTDTQIKNCLINLLNTRRFERRMNPTFGTRLYEILFEANDDNTDDILRNMVTDEVSMWIPQITVKNISIKNKDNASYTDNYIKEITIDYINNYTQQPNRLTMDIQNVKI